ncbi:hypothetical protein OG203_30285 [Nocardia sp. NBC_01499]|uniref:hypothetical protein n=1 Tax=Nocardia sp. NBC_01499 TaxID=2903597 RepID=UPI00386D057C
MVLGKILQAAGSWLISDEFAPNALVGAYQGLFNTRTAAAQTIGPASTTQWAVT